MVDAAQSSEGRCGEQGVWFLEGAEQFPTSWPVEEEGAPAVWPQSCQRAAGRRCHRSPGKRCGARGSTCLLPRVCGAKAHTGIGRWVSRFRAGGYEEVVPGFLQRPPVKVFVEHRYDFVDRSLPVAELLAEEETAAGPLQAGKSPVVTRRVWGVYGPAEPQNAVFEDVCPLLTSFLDGYNVCVMAYGQTGSGKSFTSLGPHSKGEPAPQSEALGDSGVIPRAAGELFRLISEDPSRSPKVEVSIVEVYNNDICDLLANDRCWPLGRSWRGLSRWEAEGSLGTVSCHLSLPCSRPAVKSVKSVTAHGAPLPCAPVAGHREEAEHVLQNRFCVAEDPRIRAGVPGPRRPRGAGARQAEARGPGGRRVRRREREAFPWGLCTFPGVSGATGSALRETSCINWSLEALADVLGGFPAL
ncbi:hypothetical protein E2I00_012937, partial [Balaenoptera physalus]